MRNKILATLLRLSTALYFACPGGGLPGPINGPVPTSVPPPVPTDPGSEAHATPPATGTPWSGSGVSAGGVVR